VEESYGVENPEIATVRKSGRTKMGSDPEKKNKKSEIFDLRVRPREKKSKFSI